MKAKYGFAVLLLALMLTALSASSQTAEMPAKQVPPDTRAEEVDLSSRVIFVSCPGDKELCVLALSANGQLEAATLETMKMRSPNGPRHAITLGDVFIALYDLGREKSALESDYNLLVGRYNRLAAINNTPTASNYNATTATSDPKAEERRERQQLLLNWMKLRQSNRPQTFNVNVTDCTKYPALCVH
jgi:hypothetical protein